MSHPLLRAIAAIFAVVTAHVHCLTARADSAPVLMLDFAEGDSGVRLFHGARHVTGPFGGALEFTTAIQYAEVEFTRQLDGARDATIGAWVLPRRGGEQSFLFRGVPETGPGGERWFRPRADWVNFVLGTDGHGFLLGTIHGNGRMPFPYVTLAEVPIDEWSQLVVVKDAGGYQKWYRNGVLVGSDRDAASAGVVRPFVDRAGGEPLRLAAPLGGLIGEAWVFPRQLSAEEVLRDFESKRERYAPALPGRMVELREIDARPAAGLWESRGGRLSEAEWPARRERILAGMRQVFGPMPGDPPPPLDPQVISEEDCGKYVRRKVSIQVQPGERMPAYLLIPKDLKGRAPAVICFYGTTSGAGKETTVGLSGGRPGTPPERNRDYAVWMAEAGLVAFSADYLRDGERVRPGERPYETASFYERFPDWSVHGKDAWDTMRAVDYLQSLDFIDGERIGMLGHSYGGHSTIFTMALEPRIKAGWANGPVSDFLRHGMHWAVPKGGGASQSLPGMRPFVLDGTLEPPITFYEVTALVAPRPLVVGQAVGEHRPMEEENHAAVRDVYEMLGAGDRVKYLWYAGDHDFPPPARQAAVEWFQRWLSQAVP